MDGGPGGVRDEGRGDKGVWDDGRGCKGRGDRGIGMRDGGERGDRGKVKGCRCVRCMNRVVYRYRIQRLHIHMYIKYIHNTHIHTYTPYVPWATTEESPPWP